MRKQRAAIKIFILCFTALLAATAYRYRGSSQVTPIAINEVCARNFSAATDPYEHYFDYIELYNAADADYSMDGLYLSDDRDEPRMFDMTGITVPAHGYAVIWMLSEDEVSEVTAAAAEAGEDSAGNEELAEDSQQLTCPQYYCPFALSSKGEYLFISNTDSKILASVNVPALEYNVSYGLTQDGGRSYAGMEPTPGATNSGAAPISLTKAEAPTLSAESGFYDEPFALQIHHSLTTDVYYTLDGTTPTTASIKYDGAITIDDASSQVNVYSARDDIYMHNYVPAEPVDKAVVVRAIAVDRLSGNASDVVSGTYFVGFGDKEEYDGMAVVSLVTDPVNLFDYNTGLFVMGATYDEYKAKGGFEDLRSSQVPGSFSNSSGDRYFRYMYTNAEHRGRAWERPVTVQYYDAEHTLQLTQDAGMRIAGESSRYQVQKSLNLIARGVYGSDTWQYPFWGYDGMKEIRLRASAGESVNWKETFVQSLCDGRSNAVQHSIPCAVFLDGEYWGLYQLTEQYDAAYFAHYYGVSEENLTVYKNHSIAMGDETQGMSDYDDLEEIITTYDMSQEHLYALAAERVNMDSLIDFFAANTYLSNVDIVAHHNQEMWRNEAEGADQRWQYVIYDLDQTCYDAAHDTISDYKGRETFYWPQYLCANAAFKEQYVTTLMDLANVELSYQRVHSRLVDKVDEIGAQSVMNKQRYVRADYDEADYASDVRQLDDFFRDRRSYIEQYLKEDLGLSEIATVTVTNADPDAGAVKVNSSVLTAADYTWSDDGSGTWSGEYFADYNVTLTAAALDGYVFTGWTGDVESTDPVISVPLTAEGVQVKANFTTVD